MRRPQSEFGNNMLIVVGVMLVIMTIVLHWTLPERFEKIEIIPLIVGFIFAYYGALWKDPDRAKRAGDAVAHTGDEIVDTLTKWRTGKRKTDPIVEVQKSHPANDPDAEQTVKVITIMPGAPSVQEPEKGE